LVCVARLGTGAGGRTSAKGGRGTDCREGAEDGARQKIREEIIRVKAKESRLIITIMLLIHSLWARAESLHVHRSYQNV